MYSFILFNTNVLYMCVYIFMYLCYYYVDVWNPC